MAVARLAGVGHPAGGDLQRREQGGGAMADVVVGAPLGPARAYRAKRLSAFQRLDLGLLVHAQHDRVRRRVLVQPDHVADLGLQLRIGGELERLGLPRLEIMLGPNPGHRAVAEPQLGGQQPRRPVGHTPGLSGGGARLVARISARRVAANCSGGGPGEAGQPAGRSVPRAHSACARRSPSGERYQVAQRSRCWRSLRRPAAGSWPAGPMQPAPWIALAQRRKTASSAGATTRAAADDGIGRMVQPILPSCQITSETDH